jgi:lipopolysaccharide transport system ATP-binding protein
MQTSVQFDNVYKRYDLGSRRASLKYLLPDYFFKRIEARSTSGKHSKNILWALNGVTFDVEQGEMLGLIGPNGAGKTTALSLLAGIMSPTSGEIRARGRIGALIKLGAGFHPDLSGRENVYLNGTILGLQRKEIDKLYDAIVDFSELEDFMETPVKRYSSGMYVRLGFSVAVHINPDILLVDEILSVGDVSFQSRCINRIGEVREQGSTIIYVSHNMHQIASFCDRVVYLNHGKIRGIGDPAETLTIYNQDLMNRQSSGTAAIDDGSDLTQVNGTGRLMINNVKFLNSKKEEISTIRSGDPLTLRIIYQCKEKIADPLVDIVIRDAARGNMFQATNRDFGIEFGELDEIGYLDINFHYINSNNQVLSFFVTIWNTNHTECYDWKRNFKLQVNGVPMSSGRIMFECDWEKGK